jgi:hypothetical protein
VTVEAPTHRRRTDVGLVIPTILGGACEPDCPACAAERDERLRTAAGVRDIVLGMWLEAIADGERSVESALRQMQGPLSLLDAFERGCILWGFVRAALEIEPRKLAKGKRKPKGPPTSWDKTNYDLVNLVAEDLKLKKNNVEYETSVFHRVAAIWGEWRISVTGRQVQDAYNDHLKRVPR